VDSEPRKMELWIQGTLNSWAEQGTLSRERSTQLHLSIAKLAQQERKNRLTRKAFELVAGIIITCIWLLFASCPVAAASYMSSPIHSTLSPQIRVVSILAILIYLLLKHQFQYQTTNSNFEVNYD